MLERLAAHQPEMRRRALRARLLGVGEPAAEDLDLDFCAVGRRLDLALKEVVAAQQPHPNGIVIDAEFQQQRDELHVPVTWVAWEVLRLGNHVHGGKVPPGLALEVLDLLVDVVPHPASQDDPVELLVAGLGVAREVLRRRPRLLGDLPRAVVLLHEALVVLALHAVGHSGAYLGVLLEAVYVRRDGLEALLLLAAAQRGAPHVLGLGGDVEERGLDADDAVLALLDQRVLSPSVVRGRGERVGRRGGAEAAPARMA